MILRRDRALRNGGVVPRRIACATKTPVMLAADVRGMSRSAAALFKGFAEYGEQKLIRGAFLNRVSPSMIAYDRWVACGKTGIPVLGSFPVDEALHIDSRHLGLVEPGEIPDLMSRIDRAADLLEQTLDLEQLMKIAKSAPALHMEDPARRVVRITGADPMKERALR